MTTTRAVRVHRHGGPEELRYESVPLPSIGSGDALLRHTAIGLNFIDVYHRTGLYPLDLPATLGMEAAGVVEAVGDNTTGVSVGDRVAYVGPRGAYAERRVLPAEHLVCLPDEIDDEIAAAMMLKGMTAWNLLRKVHAVQPGETILIHAAAGGVGLLLCQWGKALGATVIGTAGSDDKARLAAENGCDHPVVYSRESFAERVREITDGKGVEVVYDGVGKATFDESLDSLAIGGTMASFGNASGAVPPVDILRLTPKGLYLTRPSIMAHIRRRENLLEGARELFEAVRAGALRPAVRKRLPLAEVATAHRALEARATVGSTILLP